MRLRVKVVLPEPKKPVMMVMGMGEDGTIVIRGQCQRIILEKISISLIRTDCFWDDDLL